MHIRQDSSTQASWTSEADWNHKLSSITGLCVDKLPHCCAGVSNLLASCALCASANMSASDVVADIKLLLDGYSNHQSQLQAAKEQLNVIQDENKSLRQQLEQAKHINTQLDSLIKAHHSQVAAEVSIRSFYHPTAYAWSDSTNT